VTNSQHFLDIADGLISSKETSPAVRDWLEEAQGDFGVSRSNVDALLDKKNWTVEKPQIRVEADINQSGSLAVRWLPTIGQFEAKQPSDFEFENWFLGQVVLANQPNWGTRPRGELQWFRKVPRSLFFADDANSKVAVLAIVYGIKARYEELLAQLGAALTITNADRMRVRKDADGLLVWSFGSEKELDDISAA
jgi:hypothetical protein